MALDIQYRALPLFDSVSEIVSVYSWLHLTFYRVLLVFRPSNLTLLHRDGCGIPLARPSPALRESVYIGFIVDSHDVLRRPMRRRQLHADSPPGPRCHFGKRFRAEGQSVQPLCVCMHGYACLCSRYH